MQAYRKDTERVKSYFTRMDIPYDFKVITIPPWEMVFNEIKDGVHHLVILQGEFLSLWRDHIMMGCPYRQMINRSECLVLTIE